MQESYKPSISERISRATNKEIIHYDDQGEVLFQTTAKIKPKNRSGFVISYTQKMCDFLEKTTQGSVVRLFVYLAHNQGYGDNGVYGFRTSRAFLSKILNLNRKTIYDALEYLKSNFLVNELRINGSLEYMVNPDYVTVGSDRKARDREWSQRWEYYWKHYHDLHG